MTRKEISAAVWRVLMRPDPTELAEALIDLGCAVEQARIINSWQESETYAQETVDLAGRVLFSRILSMAAKTKISFVGDVR